MLLMLLAALPLAAQQPTDSLKVTGSASTENYCLSVRANLLRWATLTPDIGIEWRINRNIGIVVNGSWTSWLGCRGADDTTSLTEWLWDNSPGLMTAKISGITGKQIELTNALDPACIGGVRLDYDGMRVDDTISHRFDAMRSMLKNTIL